MRRSFWRFPVQRDRALFDFVGSAGFALARIARLVSDGHTGAGAARSVTTKVHHAVGGCQGFLSLIFQESTYLISRYGDGDDRLREVEVVGLAYQTWAGLASRAMQGVQREMTREGKMTTPTRATYGASTIDTCSRYAVSVSVPAHCTTVDTAYSLPAHYMMVTVSRSTTT